MTESAHPDEGTTSQVSAALRIADALPPWDPDNPPLCRACPCGCVSDGPDGLCGDCR